MRRFSFFYAIKFATFDWCCISDYMSKCTVQWGIKVRMPPPKILKDMHFIVDNEFGVNLFLYFLSEHPKGRDG